MNVKEILEILEDNTVHYSIKENIQNQIQNELISDTKYVKWLDTFTRKVKRDVFQNWACESDEELNENDKNNKQILYLFFNAIDQYAKRNFIPQLKVEIPADYNPLTHNPLDPYYGSTIYYYNVRFNDFCFSIGKKHGRILDFFCSRKKENEKEKYIDYNDVLINKKQENVDQINAILDSLSSMVTAAYESGAPIEAIVSKLDNTIKGITSKKEDKPKTLVRK